MGWRDRFPGGTSCDLDPRASALDRGLDLPPSLQRRWVGGGVCGCDPFLGPTPPRSNELSLDVRSILRLYELRYGHLGPAQHAGLVQILGFLAADVAMTDLAWAAYLLATVKHECADRWVPVVEGLGRRGDAYFEEQYGPDTDTGKRLGNTEKGDGARFKGRGYVQITGRANYRRLGKALGYGDDFVTHPDKVLDPATSYAIASYGMRNGSFTGKKLSDTIAGGHADYVNARRIINGLDQAERIAAYATQIEEILRGRLTLWDSPIPANVA